MMDSSEYCLDQALKSETEAATTTLPNVRERALQAAQRWRALAENAKSVEKARERSAMYRDTPAN